MSKAILVVGCTGSGKTYFTKQLIQKADKNALMIYDVNNEYADYYPYPFQPNIQLFLEKAKKVRSGVIVIEEATNFFAVNGRSVEMIELLIGKRHTKNTFILLFHSVGDIPRYLYRKCTDFVIFKTLDRDSDVFRIGNQQIIDAWKEVQTDAKDHKFFSSYPPPEGVKPPSKSIALY